MATMGNRSANSYSALFYIQEFSNFSSCVNQLIYEKLPHDISERHVLLLDPVLATGTSLFTLHIFIIVLLMDFCISESVSRDIA